MSKLDSEKFFCFLYDPVAPHGFCLYEPKDEDVKKVSAYPSNNFLSEVLGQFFTFHAGVHSWIGNLAYLGYLGFYMVWYV